MESWLVQQTDAAGDQYAKWNKPESKLQEYIFSSDCF